MAGLTIRRDDWDAYLREVEYEGGAAALAYARRVRALEVGPDYDGVPMIRRVLESARAVIVHSQCVFDRIRAAASRAPWRASLTAPGSRPPTAGLPRAAGHRGIHAYWNLRFLKPTSASQSCAPFAACCAWSPREVHPGGETHPDFPVHRSSALWVSRQRPGAGFMPSRISSSTLPPATSSSTSATHRR